MLQSRRPGRGARSTHRGPALVAAIALGAALAAAWPVAPAGAVTTATFPYTGAQQKFIVPAGVTSVHVLAVGGAGGNGFGPGGGPSGAPAEVSGDLEVLPGQTLYVEVGGTGIGAEIFGSEAFNGGANGGEGAGGGGGASDVRLESRPTPDTPASLFSRLIVAGGGGGGGAGVGGTTGGTGGAAGSAGGAASVGTGAGGAAGTEESGGVGCGGLCNGKLGRGTEGNLTKAGTSGGGGGGGLFGGGGGETNGKEESGGGGGGGGSSLQPAGGKTTIPAAASAPEVQISYTPPAATSGGGTPTPSSIPSNVFSLLRPVIGVGDTVTLVLDLPGKGAATAVATATRVVTARKHGKRVRKKQRFTFGTARAAVTASGALELTIKPSAAGRKALARHRPLPVAIAVTFTPTGGKAATQKTGLTLPRR
ncbi:MAG TPA: glycine-rich protein [Solirubrobacteraceae bacterium]|nr:glycine-rich protein [Solirubrobacteraceae bacterium]